MDRKNKSPHANDKTRALATLAISLLAGKWTIGIILALADGKQRFAALLRRLPGISHHVLTKELKRLQAHGIIFRTVHPTTPPSVEYELTNSGAALYVVLHASSEWATRYLDKTPSPNGNQEMTR
jgi:DNA-binding HxlR family transcriptional regulator